MFGPGLSLNFGNGKVKGGDGIYVFIAKERSAIMVAAGGWERVALLVDSGASDTVVLPSVCSTAVLHHTPKVGIEYECANKAVLENLGERRCAMKVSEGAPDPGMTMAFQVVAVHRALLSVSRVCTLGHGVVFSDNKGNFIHVGGDPNSPIPIRKSGGVYELDVWLKPKDDPGPRGFEGQGR